MKHYIGVDIGGTNVRYGLVSENGKVVSDSHFLIKADRGRDVVLKDLIFHLKSYLDNVPAGTTVSGISIGVAGFLDPVQGLVIFSPNLPGWEEVPLAAMVSEALDLDTRLENDANLYTLGEWMAGAGKGMNSLVLLTLGTGVGGGLILNNKLWNGEYGTAAEIGHTVVDPDGLPCSCGGNGCLETVSSATAMANTAREWIKDGQSCGYDGDIEQLTSADLFELALQGDELAIRVFERAGSALGVALSNVFNILGLENAIIGGGAGQTFQFLEQAIRKEINQRAFAVDPAKIRLERSILGDMAPLVGAPALFH